MYSGSDELGCPTDCVVDCSNVPHKVSATVVISGIGLEDFDEKAFAAAVGEIVGVRADDVRVVSVRRVATGNRRALAAEDALEVLFEVTVEGSAGALTAEAVAAQVAQMLVAKDLNAELASKFSAQLGGQNSQGEQLTLSVTLVGEVETGLGDAPEDDSDGQVSDKAAGLSMWGGIGIAAAIVIVVVGGTFAALRVVRSRRSRGRASSNGRLLSGSFAADNPLYPDDAESGLPGAAPALAGAGAAAFSESVNPAHDGGNDRRMSTLNPLHTLAAGLPAGRGARASTLWTTSNDESATFDAIWGYDTQSETGMERWPSVSE